MEIKQQKGNKLNPPIPLPLIVHPHTKKIKQFTGIFNGFCVEVKDPVEMRILTSNGSFGRGCLSRSYPHHDNEDVSIIRERQFNNRKKIDKLNSFNKVLVLPDSDEDDSNNERYFVNLKGVYELDYSCIKEYVNLMPEEAFFLNYELDCLNVIQNDKIVEKHELWKLFCECDNLFIVNYVVYYYYRSKNWVVKSGIKFGGDYVIYKDGPSYYHSKCVILIDVLNEKFEKLKKFSRRSLDPISLIGLNRLCEAASKDTIICQVIWPKNCEENSIYLNLKSFQIREISMKRWVPSKEHNNELICT